MKRAALFVSLALVAALGTGCNTVKHLLSPADHTHGPQPLPDVYTITGTTSVDYQIIQPVRCVDSAVKVRVKRPGEDWHECNKYEVKLDTTGVGGGGVWFRKEVAATFDKDGNLIYLVITGKPIAPAGTQYEITSTLTTGSSSHDLY